MISLVSTQLLPDLEEIVLKSRKTIHDALIEMCILKFTQDCGVSGDENYQRVFGVPPTTMLIHVGPASKVGIHDDWKMGRIGVEALLYASDTLTRTNRMRRNSTEESGMYYKFLSFRIFEK